MLFVAVKHSEYHEGILAVQSTQLKKHLEESISIRPGIMDALMAVLCKYIANVILTCLQARTRFTQVRTFCESADFRSQITYLSHPGFHPSYLNIKIKKKQNCQ